MPGDAELKEKQQNTSDNDLSAGLAGLFSLIYRLARRDRRFLWIINQLAISVCEPEMVGVISEHS